MSIYRAGNRAKAMFQETVPDQLVGLWRRLSIEENGQRDTTTQVFWLQTTSGFGDIRIPAGRPAINTLAELTVPQAIALAHQGGFAGITRLAGDRCEWHHAMDYQPFNGKADVGTLHWEGDILIEIGPDGAYREEWQRVATGPTATMTLTESAAWKGWLVLCGDRFIYMCEHRTLLPSADSLTALLSAASNKSANTTATVSHQDQQYLNCEISFGRIQQGGKPWEIQLSTLPWKEGNSLWNPDDMTVDYPNEKIVQTIGAETLAWTVQEWGELEQIFGSHIDSRAVGDLPKANLSRHAELMTKF
jgi:hypothetical protein